MHSTHRPEGMGEAGRAHSQPVQEEAGREIGKPRVPADKLSGYDSVYKIKLRSAGYRLAYEVVDDELVVYVLAVGKREMGEVYSSFARRT